jgi:hypothetical protein
MLQVYAGQAPAHLELFRYSCNMSEMAGSSTSVTDLSQQRLLQGLCSSRIMQLLLTYGASIQPWHMPVHLAAVCIDMCT